MLGAGPAGLLAAHAAEQQGCYVSVMSMPDNTGVAARSELHGCQYLHDRIPGITPLLPQAEVSYVVRGGEGYRAKVYGPEYQGPVSPDEYGKPEPHYAWDLRAAYDKLWSYWHPRIVARKLGWESMFGMLSDLDYDVCISTIPATVLCAMRTEHRFDYEMIWAMGQTQDGPDLQIPCPPNTVICDGTEDVGWYRTAKVFGVQTVEWPMVHSHPTGKRPPFKGVTNVPKPLSTNCVCWTDSGVYRVGRYGRWQKGVLVHTAYYDTANILANGVASRLF